MNCFYEKGLKFACQGCSYCCGHEPGYVFLSEADLSRLAHGLGLTDEAFTEIYCRKIDMGSFYMISLREKENFDCEFLTEKGCSVYENRPMQCRTYPFWVNVVESSQTWEEEGKLCPGINKGQKFSKNQIQEKLDTRLTNPPIVIFK